MTSVGFNPKSRRWRSGPLGEKRVVLNHGQPARVWSRILVYLVEKFMVGDVSDV